MTKIKEKQRDDFCDLAKGVAALDVILIHTAFWSGELYAPEWLRNLVLIAEVPFLIFLSGYSSNYVTSIKKQLRSLILLYLKWCFFIPLFWLCSILFRESMTIAHFKNFLFLAGDNTALPVVMGSTWFWPIYFIVVFCGIFIVKKIPKSYLYKIILMISVLYCLCVVLNLNKQVIKIFFYLLLYLIGNVAFELDIKRWKKILLTALIICVCISVPSVLAVNRSALVIPMSEAKTPPVFWYAAYSIIAPCSMMLLKSKNLKKPLLSWIGKNCFLFYLAQGISSSLLYFLLPYLEYIPVVLRFFICLVVNVGLAFAVVKLLLCYYAFLFSMKNYFSKSSRIGQ